MHSREDARSTPVATPHAPQHKALARTRAAPGPQVLRMQCTREAVHHTPDGIADTPRADWGRVDWVALAATINGERMNGLALGGGGGLGVSARRGAGDASSGESAAANANMASSTCRTLRSMRHHGGLPLLVPHLYYRTGLVLTME